MVVESKLGIFVIILFRDIKCHTAVSGSAQTDVDICDTNQSQKIQKQVLGCVLNLCHAEKTSAVYSISPKVSTI